MSLRRGIEPIIATVILVAVALIIAVAVVGYLMGLFGGLTGGSPQIAVTNVRALKENSNKLTLEMYISNTGAGSDRLLKVEVIVGGLVGTASVISVGNSPVGTAATIISGNFKGWVTASITSSQDLNPGDTIIVKLYFEKSGTQTINAVVSASS
jgi:flagellin-like protein